MARQKIFLKYKDTKFYRGLKGNVEQKFAYTQIQNNQVEDGYDWFDIRRLPRKYRSGLDIEPDLSSAFASPPAGLVADMSEFERISALEAEAHREVLRRAIDDDYDFGAATRDNYGQFFRRIRRWLRTKSGP